MRPMPDIREIPCGGCNGDGGFEEGPDYVWQRCLDCGGLGYEAIEMGPADEIEDLDERCGDA